MSRQIAMGYSPPSAAQLEQRILALETKVTELTEKVQALAGELELSQELSHELSQELSGELDLPRPIPQEIVPMA
jgi:uncharacterized protein YjbK